MNQIRSVLSWCKANIITVVCIVVVLAAGGSFVWPTWAWSSDFKATLASRSGDLSRISSLTATTITIPPSEATGPPKEEKTIVNDKRIEALKKIYDGIVGEYDDVL